MKKLKVIVLFIFSAFILCSCTNTPKQTLNKITLAEPARTVFYCPLYVSDSCGFFEKEGLEIQIKTANGSDKAMTAVLSHGADIGLLGLEAVVYVYNEGKENPPRLFAQLTKRDGSFLVGRTAEFNSWGDLIGKSVIAGRIGGMPEMCLEYILKEKGVFNDVNLITNIQFDLMSAAFSNGVGDYVMLFDPIASSFERDKGYHILRPLGKDSGEIAYTCFCACGDYIKKNSGVIQSFTNAVYKGQKWVYEHTPDEIVSVISKYFPDSDKSLLLKSIENYKSVDVWAESPVIKKDDYNLTQKITTQAGQINKKIEFEKVSDNSFAIKAVS